MSTRRIVLATLALLALTGCATIGYYTQAISGHYAIIGRARAIDELLADSATATPTREKLARVAAMRDFATHALGLPDNGSYRRYADLERPFAVWNVFAAPELSLKPKEWCFPFAGCVAYRGYFARADAEREADELRTEGHDVYLGGVAAYSTLGWFDDPLLNTMLARPEPELAGLIFHELAHQKLYVPNDTAFNESFAATVEHEGVRRWLAAHGAADQYGAYLERQRRREQFVELARQYRDKLAALYGSAQPDDAKRSGKQSLFEQFGREYGALKQEWGGYAGFDGWVEELNNAKFVSIGLYHDHRRAFEALLAQHDNDLTAFYRAVEQLAREPKQARQRLLAALAAVSAARDVGSKL